MKTPSELHTPSYLLNFPFTVDDRNLNNAVMQLNATVHKLGKYNLDVAFTQFMKLYNLIISNGGLIYLLPSEQELQDLPYTANLGCYLPHLKDPTIIISNFKSEPRQGEEKIGIKFLESMRYKTFSSPYFWEGEADLKWVKDNLYIGGHGIRTDIKSYFWMSDRFDMDIVHIKMADERLYHFDCMFFPISDTKALAATSVIDNKGIKALEKYFEIIEVPHRFIYDGWTNAIRLNNKIFYDIPSPPICQPDSRKRLDDLISKADLEPLGIDLSEFYKSGADLSCFVMHLNYNGRK